MGEANAHAHTQAPLPPTHTLRAQSETCDESPQQQQLLDLSAVFTPDCTTTSSEDVTKPHLQLCLESSRALFEGGSSIITEVLSLDQVETEASWEIFRRVKSH